MKYANLSEKELINHPDLQEDPVQRMEGLNEDIANLASKQKEFFVRNEKIDTLEVTDTPSHLVDLFVFGKSIVKIGGDSDTN